MIEDPVEPLEPAEVQPPSANLENAQALIDGADYSTGNPVIHIDLNAGPADFANPDQKVDEVVEENNPAQPGDGFTLTQQTIPAEENEFSQENQAAWPIASADHQPEADTSPPKKSDDDPVKETDPDMTDKQLDPIAPEMTPLNETEKVIVEVDELEPAEGEPEEAPADPNPQELEETEAETAKDESAEAEPPASEPEEKTGLTKEDIDRFFTWED